MGTRTIVNVTWPVMASSLLLLMLGGLAAWWVDRTQSANSQLITQEVHGVVAAQDLYTRMREFRRNLDLYLRIRSVTEFEKIADQRGGTQELLNQVKQTVRTPEEQKLIDVVEQGYTHFYAEYQRIRTLETQDHQQAAISHLVDQILTREVLEPAQKFVDYNRQVIDTSNYALKAIAKRMRIGFLLLGLCGALAGLALGVGVALKLRRTMIKLHVSVQGVAGRLTEILGPVTLAEGTTMQELQLSLQVMEQHIAEVVERLQKQELEILRREQLASLGQIAAGMAHELRNPLMPMKMLVQSAMQKGDQGGGLNGRSLRVVSDEIERLERSIQAFLDFAKPPQIEKKVFDMCGMCDQTLELISARAAQQDVRLVRAWPTYPVCVEADPLQLRQVVLNLLLNSLDALPDGGELKVSIERQAATDVASLQVSMGGPLADLPLSASTAGTPLANLPDDFELSHLSLTPIGADEYLSDWCAVTITDDGIGMPADLVPRIFEPFVTTKETGHGLGLPTCRRVIQAHGGAITAENRREGGARFTFYLRMTHCPSETGAVV